MALQEQGELEDAIASHQKALELQPDLMDADYKLVTGIDSDQNRRHPQLECPLFWLLISCYDRTTLLGKAPHLDAYLRKHEIIGTELS
ncbi:MAG: hypothetical protein WCD53_17210 [Microcoleus sp.]